MDWKEFYHKNIKNKFKNDPKILNFIEVNKDYKQKFEKFIEFEQ